MKKKEKKKIAKCQLEAEGEQGSAWEVALVPYVSPLPQSPHGIFEVLVFDSFYYLVLINLLKPLCLGGGVSWEGNE